MDKRATAEEIAAFISDTFRSVWTLELLILIKGDCAKRWSREELIDALRASKTVVEVSLDSLLAAGLLVEEDHCVQYCPANDALGELADATQALYVSRPATVRRLVISSGHEHLNAFANAFRLRKD